MTNIRPFDKERDYPAFAALANDLRLHSPTPPGTEESWRLADCNRPGYEKWGRFVAEKEGEIAGIVAYSQPTNNYHSEKFEVYIGVYPKYQRQGIGTALYQAFSEAIAPHNPIEINADSYDDIPSRIQFWQKQGFVETWQDCDFHLNVASFDPGVLQGAADRVAASGIRIHTYSELKSDSERDRKVYELHCTLCDDIPSTEPFTHLPFEDFKKKYLQEDSPSHLPDACFVAIDGDDKSGDYIGLSALIKPGSGDYFYTHLTGVLSEYRGQSIASALKLRTALYAKEKNVPEICTTVSQKNRNMLAINEKMGFVKQPSWIDFKKEVKV